jgi:hypothetical protein
MLTGTRDRDGRRVRYACRLGTALPHPRITVTEHLILPAVQAEAARLRTPERVEGTADAAERTQLEDRRARILDMYEAGDITKDDYRRRLAAIDDAEAHLDVRDVVMTVPEVDWTWAPRKLNGVLRAIFDRIELDPATFQPVSFAWSVPEWRA